ncbi:MAG: hypothetical protein SGJ00_00790 [bacterium]|nr:hypothetical protein [bacterium]
MINKQLLSILSIVVSIGLALGIYLYFAQIDDKNIKPIQIIPDNAAFVIESNNSSLHLRQLADPTFMDRLMANENVASFYEQLSFYDSLIQTNETISKWFSQGQALYSFHAFNNKSVSFFMAVQTAREVEPNNALAFFQEHFPGRFKVSKRKFMNEDVYDFTDFKEGKNFSIAFKSKLMLFSPDGSLVELGLIKINKFNNQVIPEDKLSFVKNSGNGLNVYFNYKNLPNLVQSTFSEEYQRPFTILENFAERTVFNLVLDDDEIELKGATQTHETDFQFLDLLNAQAPIKNNLQSLLPDGIHFAYTLGFNGYPSFYKNINEYLLSKKLYLPYKAYIDSIEKHLQISFSEKLASKFANHAAILALDEPGVWKDSLYILAIESSDPTGLEVLLQEMEKSVNRKYTTDSSLSIIDTVKNEIPRAYLGDAFKFYFTDLFEGMEAKFYIKKNGYFFFANNANILLALKKKWAENKYLVQQENYKDFEANLAPHSNLELLIFNEHAAKFALNFLNNNWFSLLNQNMGIAKRLKRIGIQYAGSNDKIFASQVYAQVSINKANKTEEVWSINLDTNLLTAPQVVTNYQLGTMVVMAQDMSNQLYMVDREGKTLWKQKLDGPILSPFIEINLYNNGKRQWIFNTSSYIYLIGDDGSNLSGWPVWIPTGTNYPVTVLDPNLDRNYQIFATGRQYKISGFNTQGRLLPYWSPKEVWPNVSSSLGAFQHAGELVYWYLNEKGSIQFLNRQAQKLNFLNLDTLYQFIKVQIEAIDTGQFQLIGLDSNQLVQLNFFSTRSAVIKSQNAIGYNQFEKVNTGSKLSSYLLQGRNQVALEQMSSTAVFQQTFENGTMINPKWFFIGGAFQLVYQNPISLKLHIENTKGVPYKPFPMDVSGPFLIGNIFNEADQWLIYGDNKKGLHLYRIK